MKNVFFLTSDGGVWDCFQVPRALPFRRIAQRAKTLENATGQIIRIMLADKDSEQDITDWVYNRAGN